MGDISGPVGGSEGRPSSPSGPDPLGAPATLQEHLMERDGPPGEGIDRLFWIQGPLPLMFLQHLIVTISGPSFILLWKSAPTASG